MRRYIYAITRRQKMRRKMPKRRRKMIPTGLNTLRSALSEKQRRPKARNRKKFELEYLTIAERVNL